MSFLICWIRWEEGGWGLGVGRLVCSVSVLLIQVSLPLLHIVGNDDCEVKDVFNRDNIGWGRREAVCVGLLVLLLLRLDTRRKVPE